MERNPAPATEETLAIEKPCPPVCVRIHTVSTGRIDTEGASLKWALDAIVRLGILRDDNTDIIQEVCQTGRQGQENQTIITIEWRE
jgi:hypothetical protein